MNTVPWPPKGLAKPAHRALAGAGVTNLEALAGRREADIAALHGMGPNGMKVLREALAARGLSFAG
jgi:predicted Fe-Mo cluster-binding NifX family protein